MAIDLKFDTYIKTNRKKVEGLKINRRSLSARNTYIKRRNLLPPVIFQLVTLYSSNGNRVNAWQFISKKQNKFKSSVPKELLNVLKFSTTLFYIFYATTE